jgi:hypothetical protein
MKVPKSTFKNQAKLTFIIHLGIFILGLLAVAVYYLIR